MKPEPMEEPVAPYRPYKDKYPADKWRHTNLATDLALIGLQCCGVKEVHGVQHKHAFYSLDDDGLIPPAYVDRSPGEFVRDVQKQYKICGRHRPFWIFTEARPKGKEHPNVAAIEAYVKEHDLGDVTLLGPRWNGNSGNWVTLGIWQMDEKQAGRMLAHKPVLPE
jgi:hypothetical protein